jgi:L-iditol 2-dehydrogenase
MEATVFLAKLSGEAKGIFIVGSGYQIASTHLTIGYFSTVEKCPGMHRTLLNEKIEEMIAEMKAAVLYGKEDLRLERVPVPQAGPGELIVRVGAALTCGTDLKVYRRGYHAKMLKPPIPFGHEVAGVVSEVGAGVTRFRIGDRVVALNSAPCDACFFCRQGQQNLCEDLLFNNGAYAEFIRIPERIVEKNTLLVPEGVLLEHAALTEPLACVVRGLEGSGAKADDTMVVIGAGPIGLMFMHVAELAGVRVIAVVKRDDQVEAARVFGAKDIVQIGNVDDVVQATRKLTPGGRGADVVIEAVATPATWEWAVEMVRKGGVVNFFGGPPSGTKVGLDTNRLHYGDITLKASFHHTPATCRTAFGLVTSGLFKSAEYITGRASLDDVPELFAKMMSRNGGSRDIKTAVFPRGVPR